MLYYFLEMMVYFLRTFFKMLCYFLEKLVWYCCCRLANVNPTYFDKKYLFRSNVAEWNGVRSNDERSTDVVSNICIVYKMIQLTSATRSKWWDLNHLRPGHTQDTDCYCIPFKLRTNHFICRLGAIVCGAVVVLVALVLLVDALLLVTAVHEALSHWSTLGTVSLVGCHNQSLKNNNNI